MSNVVDNTTALQSLLEAVNNLSNLGGSSGSNITIESVTESTADGGINVITFSDGTTLSIRNGTKGSTGSAGTNGTNGKDGTSVTVKSVSESTADGGSNVVTFSDNKTLTIKNGSKGSTGSTGATGRRGTGLLPTSTAPSSYTTAVGDITPKYRMEISTIKTQAGVTDVYLGDTVRYSYYHYPIAYLDASYAYFTTRVSIRGASGAAGAAGATTDEVIAALTKESWVFTLADGSTVTKEVPLV